MLMLFSLTAMAQPNRGNGIQGRGNQASCQALDTLPLQDLTADEAAGLAFMREEEKLARDVYQELYRIWGLPIFATISISEQRHFDALGSLLSRYQLPDPAQGHPAGAFTDPELAVLYDALVEQGKSSVAAALRVGATIEDLDISDLRERLGQTDNLDITTVYQNLELGSCNHLRAFVAQLENLSESYEAQFLSVDEMAEILASAQARRNGPGRGPGAGGNNGSCPFGNTP
jgi:hypothetical protein